MGTGGGTTADLVRFVTFFQRGGFILWPSFSQDCNCWEYCRHLFWWSFQAFPQDRTGFVLHTVRYFCETSFSPYGFHLYTTTTVLLNSIPYGTSSKPSFSPYGFHSLFAFHRTSPHWLFPHQYRHTPYGIQPNFPQPYGIFVPVFFIPYGLKKP